MSVIKENEKHIVDTLKWNGNAKKNGFEMPFRASFDCEKLYK